MLTEAIKLLFKKEITIQKNNNIENQERDSQKFESKIFKIFKAYNLYNFVTVSGFFH